MTQKSLSTLICCLSSVLIFAQSSIVISEETLVFKSQYEKETFLNIQDNDYFELLYSIGNPHASKANYLAYRQRLDKFESNYTKLSFDEEKIDKSLKKLKKGIDEEWLKLYRLNALPYDLTEQGIFNCVTGTMLYSQILQDFGQKVVINVYPEHVNLDVFYGKNKVLIEATSRDLGYIVMDRDYKIRQLKALKLMKIISDEEFSNGRVDELFEKYYFEELTTSDKGLAALQYYNNGLYQEELENVEASIEELIKSYYLQPFQITENVLYSSLMAHLYNKIEYSDRDLTYLKLAMQLSSINDRDYRNASDLFGWYTQNMMVEKQEPMEYSKTTNSLLDELNQTELIDEISFIYNMAMYRYGVTNQGYIESDSFIQQAYLLKPKNQDIQELSLHHIVQRTTAYSSPESWYEYLSNAEDLYTFLDTNTLYQSFKAEVNLASSAHYFTIGSKKQALEELEKFEAKKESISLSLVNVDLIADVYGRAVSYYYTAGNDRKALEMVNKGLELAPNNSILLMKKRILMN